MYKSNQTLVRQVLRIIFVCLILTVFLTPDSCSQGNAPTVYVGVNFIKVRPGKQGQYQQLIDKYGKKINEYFYKKDNLLGWYLYKTLVPSGSSVDYNYASVNVVTTLSSLLDPSVSSKEIIKKVFPEMSDKMISDLMAKYDSCREVVRSEIYVPVPGASTGDSTNPAPAKYMEVDMMRPTEGKTDDYIKMETDVFKPIHAERIKSGYLRSWGLYQRAFPDERSGFEFVTVNFLDNLDKMGGYEDAVKKVTPQTDINAMFKQTAATRTLIRSEIWKLVDFVDRSNTKK